MVPKARYLELCKGHKELVTWEKGQKKLNTLLQVAFGYKNEKSCQILMLTFELVTGTFKG